MNNLKDKETYLLDLAVAISSGLKSRSYKPGATNFLVREEAIRIVVNDPEVNRSYTIVIKELSNDAEETRY